MSSTDEIITVFKNQIKIENKIVDSAAKSLVEIKNQAVESILKGILLDSTKHAEMYSAAITLLTDTPQALTEEDLDKQRELIEQHISLEKEVMKKLRTVIPYVENKKVKFLLNSILSDEVRHHALLKGILDVIISGETITEDDWWDVLWDNVPFHGTPGG